MGKQRRPSNSSPRDKGMCQNKFYVSTKLDTNEGTDEEAWSFKLKILRNVLTYQLMIVQEMGQTLIQQDKLGKVKGIYAPDLGKLLMASTFKVWPLSLLSAVYDAKLNTFKCSNFLVELWQCHKHP